MKWINKYRPKSVKECMLPTNEVERKVIFRLFESGECAAAGVLFYDSVADGGTGKSTCANLLVEHLQAKGWGIFRLDTTGNTLRELDELAEQLSHWYENPFFKTPTKTIIVGHEISKSPTNYIDGLRDVMDRFNENVLFIFTDNHYDKLAANSPQVFKNQRCISLNFDTVSRQETIDYCTKILDAEGLNTAVNRDRLQKLTDSRKLSIRGIITALEGVCL